MRNLIVILILCSVATVAQIAGAQKLPKDGWLESICKGKEKVAKLNFFVHDVLSGPNATILEVARAENVTATSPTSFGLVRVVDDKMTLDPNINSPELGRVQGHVVSSDFRVPALTLTLNFYFTSGKYKGSTISILGRNQILNPLREFSVVGGTGVFGLARGRAFQRTYSFDVVANYGVLEFTLYVAYV